MPMAAVTQMTAAVVMPLITRWPCRITPAPRKPMPVTICAATRPESPVVVVKANDAMVNVADPRHTRESVRSPAGFSRRCRSPPTRRPQRIAAKARTVSSHGAGKWTRQLSHNQEKFVIPPSA